MADFAGAALVQPVDMEIMEIAIAVAETGQGVGPFVLYHLTAVAFKAEGKIVRAVRQVEFFRKLPLQKFWEPRPVRLMAAETVTGGNRLVDRFTFYHIRVMTVETELRARLFQLHAIVGLVGIVAGRAVASGNRRMGVLVLELILVAHKTESGACALELHAVRRFVRIVTGRAVTGSNRAMHEFFYSLIVVTVVTELGALLHQRNGPLFVGVFFPGDQLVARGAFAVSHGIVDELVTPHFRVAFEANGRISGALRRKYRQRGSHHCENGQA